MNARRSSLNSFYAQQRGNSSVYGGPQMPAPPQPPPSFAASSGGGLTPGQQLLEQIGNKKQQSGGYGGLFGGAAGGLGKILGIGAQAVKAPFTASAHMWGEAAKVLPDALEVVNPLMLAMDEDKLRADDRSVIDKFKDPSYGYGQMVHSTGNKWADRGVGLAGDILMDPLTYVGGAATKVSSHTIGKAGRTYMAETIARMGNFADDAAREAAVASAGKYGVAFLDDATRATAGVGAPGIYFGIGKQSKRIPGTQRLGSALEKGFAKVRVGTYGRITAPAGAKMRAVPEVVQARRVLDAGRTIDGVTPVMAAERMAFYNDVEHGAKTFAELKGRDVHELLRGVDSRASVEMTHAMESGDFSADSFRKVFRSIGQDARDRGIDMGDLGDDYLPHRYLPEWRKFMSDNPNGRAIASHFKIDPNEAPSAVFTRVIKGGEKIKLPDGTVFEVPLSGTIKDFNEATFKQFGVKALEDDIRKLMSGYITEVGRAIGLREAWQGLTMSKSNIVQRLDAVGVEQLDELAVITANKEMRGLIEKAVEARGRKLGERAGTAAEVLERLRKSVITDVEASVRKLGDDHKVLRGELQPLIKLIKATETDEAGVVKQFNTMYGKAQKEFDRVVKDLQVASERVEALRGEQVLADSLRTDAARQLPSSSGPRFARRADDAVGDLRDRGGNIDDSLTGVVLRDGTELDLYRADDGGHWWQRTGEDEWYGPFGLSETDEAADARDAIVALGDIEDGLVSPAKRATGEPVVSAAVRQAELAEARLADEMDLAVDALTRIDELGEQLFDLSSQWRMWDEIADSPEMLAEEAAKRSIPEETTRFIPELARPDGRKVVSTDFQGHPIYGESDRVQFLTRSATYGADGKVKTPAERFNPSAVAERWDQELERQTRQAGRSSEIVRASEVEIEQAKGELERVQAIMARIESELRQTGEAWVPLHLRSRRAQLLKRVAGDDAELKDLARKEQLALNRQDRLRRARSAPAFRDEAAPPPPPMEHIEGDVWRIPTRQQPVRTATQQGDVASRYSVSTEGLTAAERDLLEQLDVVRNGGADAGGLPQHVIAELEATVIPKLRDRHYEILTVKMELEQDLRNIADEYVGKVDAKPGAYAEAMAVKRADLAESQRMLTEIEVDISLAARADRIPLQLRRSTMEKERDAIINHISNNLQSKKWHERLARGEGKSGLGVAEANSPKTMADQLDLIRRVERVRNDGWETVKVGDKGNVSIAGQEVTEVGEQRVARTQLEIALENEQLREQLDQIPEPTVNPMLDRQQVRAPEGATQAEWDRIRGRTVSDEEAQVVADHLRFMADNLHSAEARYRKLKNEMARDYPSLNRNIEHSQFGRPRTQQVTDQGVPILDPNKGMTKWEYDQLAEGAKPVVGSRRSGRGMRGEAVAQQDELGVAADTGEDVIGELDVHRASSGAGLGDETVDAADSIVGVADEGELGFDAQLQQYQQLTDEQVNELTTRIKDAQALVKEARDQYNRALRSFGVDESAGDGFAYGRWGNIILVDTSGSGSVRHFGKKNIANAVNMTEKDLEQAVRDAGKWPKTGKRPRHQEMAALLGWKAKLFKPNEVQYKNLPEGLKQSVVLTQAKQQIRRMGEVGRRSVLADARSAERFRNEPLIVARREIEEKLRRNAAESAEIGRVQQEAFFQREVAAQAEASTAESLALAERVAANAGSTQQQAHAARYQADRAVRDEAMRGIEAGGQVQARNEATAGAVAAQARLERQVDGLAQVEKTLGEREARQIWDLQADRAMLQQQADITADGIKDTAARQAAVRKVADKVPKKLKGNKPSAVDVKKRLNDLRKVMDAAAADGSPESLATAQLFDQATRAAVSMDSEILFQKSLKDLAARIGKANKVLKSKTATDAEKLAAAQNSPAGQIMRLAHDGFAAIEEKVFPEGADYVVKSEMHRMLKEFDGVMRGAEPEWLKYYDEANRFFKTWATATPGFHVRNLMSATFMNMTEGVGVRTHLQAGSKWREYANASKVDGGAEKFFNSLDKEWQDAFSAVYGSGTGGSFEFAELGSEFAEGTFGALTNNAVTRKSRQVGVDWVEGPARLALAHHYISKGGDTRAAMNAITRIHFDYSQVSNFDRQMKRIIPFWTFMSRNLPLQFEQMLARPKAYAIYNHVMRNLSQDEDGEGMPQWLSEVGGITVGRDLGILGGKDLVLRPDMPHVRLGQEINSMFPNPTRMAASVSPWLRVPFELGMNHSAFYDGELFREGEGGLGDQAMYAANNLLPPFAAAQRLTGMGDYEGKALEKQANYVGLPITGVSDEQRRRALQNAAGG